MADLAAFDDLMVKLADALKELADGIEATNRELRGCLTVIRSDLPTDSENMNKEGA